MDKNKEMLARRPQQLLRRGYKTLGGVMDGPDSPPQQEIYLQTIRMNDLIADGALHEHEVKLFLLILNGVFLAGLPTDETHCRVRQDRLQDDRESHTDIKELHVMLRRNSN